MDNLHTILKVTIMTEKWNQFVYDLCDAQQRDVDENEYHRLIETQFQLLGWAKYRGEICHKPNIPIGNNNFIQPDILIKRDGEELFVIEVKRPVHSISQREIQQLESYMRQRKIKFGIYIGEHIELFYDKPESTNAISVLKIPLELNNKFGEMFVELFGKENYSSDSLTEFCENRISEKQQELKKIEAQQYLVANGDAIVADNLKQYLRNDYKDSFSEDEIEEILSGLTISVLPKTIVKEMSLPSVSQIQRSTINSEIRELKVVANSKSFSDIYNSIENDIRRRRITSLSFRRSLTPVSYKGDKIYYGETRPKPINNHNLEILYNYFLNQKIIDLSSWDSNDFFNLISKLTNGKTNTLDYIYYASILQEMLNRSKYVQSTK